MKMLRLLLGLAVACIAPACAPAQAPVADDAATAPAEPMATLTSWNAGPTRAAIEDFVARVTDPGSADFVPEPERIAVFDNDGTLWAEKPVYFQLLFGFDLMTELAEADADVAAREPFRTLLAEGPAGLADLDVHELLGAVVEATAV